MPLLLHLFGELVDMLYIRISVQLTFRVLKLEPWSKLQKSASFFEDLISFLWKMRHRKISGPWSSYCNFRKCGRMIESSESAEDKEDTRGLAKRCHCRWFNCEWRKWRKWRKYAAIVETAETVKSGIYTVADSNWYAIMNWCFTNSKKSVFLKQCLWQTTCRTLVELSSIICHSFGIEKVFCIGMLTLMMNTWTLHQYK